MQIGHLGTKFRVTKCPCEEVSAIQNAYVTKSMRIYLGAQPAHIGASLVSSEELRCLQCDSILVLSWYHPWYYKINPCLGAI